MLLPQSADQFYNASGVRAAGNEPVLPSALALSALKWRQCRARKKRGPASRG